MIRFASLAVALTGCLYGHDADYGEPTAQTRVSVSDDGGFGGYHRSVELVGTSAHYTVGDLVGQGGVSADNVAAIITALEDVGFLGLEERPICTNAPTDHSTVTIDVSLEKGANNVQHYLGCHGGIFDELVHLDQQIYDLSGFTDWESLD